MCHRLVSRERSAAEDLESDFFSSKRCQRSQNVETDVTDMPSALLRMTMASPGTYNGNSS